MTGIDAIVLAAGSGTRFGGGKMLAPFRGRPLVCHALDTALQSSARRVVLVTGAEAEAVGTEARRHAADIGALSRLTIVHAPDYADGMSASLKAGIAALPRDSAGVFVFLGDMPLIPDGLTQQLAGALTKPGTLAAAPFHSETGRRGHPVLFSAALFAELALLEGDKGASQILERHRADTILVQTDNAGILFDVDRRADI